MDRSDALTLSDGFAPRPSAVENRRSATHPSPLRRLIREPLLHFLLIGLALFLSFGRGASPEAEDKRILVTQAQVELLARQFETTWHRLPTDQELAHLVETYVHDEILYREGRSLGLDRDDPIIKRRVRQKLELMAEEIAGGEAPSDVELAAYLQGNPATFTRPALVTFEQIFLGQRDRTELIAVWPPRHGRWSMAAIPRRSDIRPCYRLVKTRLRSIWSRSGSGSHSPRNWRPFRSANGQDRWSPASGCIWCGSASGSPRHCRRWRRRDQPWQRVVRLAELLREHVPRRHQRHDRERPRPRRRRPRNRLPVHERRAVCHPRVRIGIPDRPRRSLAPQERVRHGVVPQEAPELRGAPRHLRRPHHPEHRPDRRKTCREAYRVPAVEPHHRKPVRHPGDEARPRRPVRLEAVVSPPRLVRPVVPLPARDPRVRPPPQPQPRDRQGHRLRLPREPRDRGFATSDPAVWPSRSNNGARSLTCLTSGFAAVWPLVRARHKEWFLVLKPKKPKGEGGFFDLLYRDPRMAGLAEASNVIVSDFPDTSTGKTTPPAWLIDRMSLGLTLPGTIQAESLTRNRPTIAYFPVIQDTPQTAVLKKHGLAFTDPGMLGDAVQRFTAGVPAISIPEEWVKMTWDPFSDGLALDRIVEFLYSETNMSVAAAAHPRMEISGCPV